VFGCQAPDSGNAEILAHTDRGAEEGLSETLLDNQIGLVLCDDGAAGGADPEVFTTRATRVGSEWRIDGEKWFASNARFAAFFIVRCGHQSGAPLGSRMSTLIVPAARRPRDRRARWLWRP